MCKRLADVLGWREDFVYYCEGNYYVVDGKHLLVKAVDEATNYWSPSELSIDIDLDNLIIMAEKASPRRYYLAHTYLTSDRGGNYLVDMEGKYRDNKEYRYRIR